MTRKILVIGGTGFLGRRLTEAFVRNGDAVAVLSRGNSTVQNTESLVADRGDAGALAVAVGDRTFDVVVDNIAFSGDDVSSVLQVARLKVGHYLLISSAAVYADRFVRRPLSERDADLSLRAPFDAPDPFHPRLGHAYANGKREAERVLQTSGVPWTALRPPVVLASDDRTMRVWWLVQRVLDGEPLLIPEWGAGRVFQLAWTHDIARATVAAAGNPRSFGRAYNVAQLEVYTAESWIETAAAVLGVPASYASFPEHAAQRLGLEDYALPVAGRPFGHMLLDASAIRCELGFEPVPESVWLAETLRGCAANPPPTASRGYERRSEEVRVARALLSGDRSPSTISSLPARSTAYP